MKQNTELIRLARQGDVHAFALLYETIYKDLYRMAVYTLRHPQDAEDAVSEAVTDAFAQIHTLREETAFRSWMFRILSAKCSRKIRQYAERTDGLDENITVPEQDLCEKLDTQRALRSLSAEDQLIVSMSVFAGYTSQEIGDILGLNPNTVRSRQSRALKKLEAFLQPELSGGSKTPKSAGTDLAHQ